MKQKTKTTEKPSEATKEKQGTEVSDESIRYAVVGLGYIAQQAVLPSFKNLKNSKLTALVSGDSEKLETLGKRYGVEHLYSREEYIECLESGEIDAVYIATPNSTHRYFVEQALMRDIHVLCEKPLTAGLRAADSVAAIADESAAKLMVAYRLHFDPANLEAMKIAQSELGDLRFFNSIFSFQVNDKENIRLQDAAGGGPLRDIGIYCINASRYLFKEEPIEVYAKAFSSQSDRRFEEVPECISVIMTFPRDRVAAWTCSFGASDTSEYTIVGSKGRLRLECAFDFAEDMILTYTVNEKEQKKTFQKHDQFGAEIQYFSDCIQKNVEPEANVIEGLLDMEIIDAIEDSLFSKKPIPLHLGRKRQRPSEKQKIELSAVKPPSLVNAHGPH